MQLNREKGAFGELGVGVIAISTEGAEDLAKAEKKTGASFPFVGDPAGRLIDSFGLRHVGGHPLKGTDIARPASVLLGRDGKLLWTSYAENYRVRPTPEATLAAVKGALGGA